MDICEIHVYRKEYLSDRTLSDVLVRRGGKTVYTCCALELPWRDNERRVSCIPAGIYGMARQFSTARGTEVWWLLAVPERTAIQWHSANWPPELLGCIAPCTHFADLDGDGVVDGANSRKALMGLEKAVEGTTPVTIIHGDGRDTWPPVEVVKGTLHVAETCKEKAEKFTFCRWWRNLAGKH